MFIEKKVLCGSQNDEMARATALAVITTPTVKTMVTKKKHSVDLLLISDLINAVREYFGEKWKISESQINRRLKVWANQGWIKRFKDGISLTSTGEKILNQMAATAI